MPTVERWGEPLTRFAYCLAFLLCMLGEGCTATYPVVGSFDDYNEVFLGKVNANLMNGTSSIDVQAKNSGAQCKGGSRVLHIPASNYTAGAFLIPYCGGQTGFAELSCNDGRSVSATWTADSCTSGYGVGHDQRGARFQFAFGMSEPEALARFQTQMTAVASRPALPEYRPKETRKEIGFSVGTAFLISSDGWLVTNYHVIEDAKEVAINVDGELRPATLQSGSKENDYAILKANVTGRPIPFRRPNTSTVVAEDVMTMGYPLITMQGQSLKASFGRVNALSGMGDDPRFLQIDVPIQPGNSGGPLINDQGELVGVVTATLNEVAVLKQAGTLPQNVNYAIKATNFQGAVSSVAVTNTSPVNGFKAIAETYAKSIFLVIAK